MPWKPIYPNPPANSSKEIDDYIANKQHAFIVPGNEKTWMEIGKAMARLALVDKNVTQETRAQFYARFGNNTVFTRPDWFDTVYYHRSSVAGRELHISLPDHEILTDSQRHAGNGSAPTNPDTKDRYNMPPVLGPPGGSKKENLTQLVALYTISHCI